MTGSRRPPSAAAARLPEVTGSRAQRGGGARALLPTLVVLGLLVLVWAASTGPVRMLGTAGARPTPETAVPSERPSATPTPSDDMPTYRELTRGVRATADLSWIGQLVAYTVLLAVCFAGYLLVRSLWRNRWRRPEKPADVHFDLTPDGAVERGAGPRRRGAARRGRARRTPRRHRRLLAAARGGRRLLRRAAAPRGDLHRAGDPGAADPRRRPARGRPARRALPRGALLRAPDDRGPAARRPATALRTLHEDLRRSREPAVRSGHEVAVGRALRRRVRRLVPARVRRPPGRRRAPTPASSASRWRPAPPRCGSASTR